MLVALLAPVSRPPLDALLERRTGIGIGGAAHRPSLNSDLFEAHTATEDIEPEPTTPSDLDERTGHNTLPARPNKGRGAD